MQISAQTLKDPLLAALGSLAENKAHNPIPFLQVLERVCTDLQIDPEDTGQATQTKLQEAFRALKKDGLACQQEKTRGKWAITPAGITVLGKASGPEEEEKQVEDPEATGYHSDPFIRALAAEQTKCFGSYSLKAKDCKTCPLAGSCRNAVVATLSGLAAQLALQDAKDDQAATQDRDILATPKSPWDNIVVDADRVHPSTNYSSTPCSRCGEPIQPQTEMIWVKDVKSGPNPKGGVFHPNCAPPVAGPEGD